MQFNYSITEDEFVEYVELVRPLRHLKKTVRNIALGAFGLCLVLAFVSTGHFRVAFLALAFAFLFVAFASGYFSAQVIKRMFRNNPMLSAEKTVNFSLDQIVSDTKFQHVETKWSSFVRVAETKLLIVMFLSKNMGSPVPKRIFSPEQMIAFRQLLKEKIPGAPSATGPSDGTSSVV